MTAKDIAIIITAVAVPGLMFLAGAIYHICEKIKSRKPHKSDDEEDNPITKFKDDLAEIYENYPNGKLKKLARAVWDRVEQIEKWHDEEIRDRERKYYSAKCDTEELKDRCNKYNKEVGEWGARYDNLKSKFEESEECLNHSLEREANLRKANEGLHKQLREEQEKNKIPLFTKPVEAPEYLISENTFGSQINPFSKIVVNKEPLTATEARELAERLQMLTSQPIVLDSEALNEPPINNEEFVKKLRDWWGLEASKAVEIATPDADKKEERYVTADELRMEYARVLLYARPKDVPIKHYRVRVVGTYNNGRDMLHTDWTLPATSINEIIDVLGKDGLHIIGGEELPI